MKSLLFSSISLSKDIALLMLRSSLGLMMLFGHGLHKMLNFEEVSATFPELITIPPAVMVCIAIFAEVFCSIALVLGFATRIALLPLIVTMIGAVSIEHIDDTFMQVEPALLYLTVYASLFLLGPGHFSLDSIISHQKRVQERSKPDPW